MTEKRIRDYIIHLDKRIGEGANGEVFYGERIADKQKCAIKVI
jgi:serine/threonine protein kinase